MSDNANESTQTAVVHDGAAAAEHEHAGASRAMYIGIGVVLAAVTGFEILVPGMMSDGLDLRPPLRLILALMGFAVVKAGLVAAFYMHLRYDSRSYTALMIMAAIVVSYFLWMLTFVGSGLNFNAGF